MNSKIIPHIVIPKTCTPNSNRGSPLEAHYCKEIVRNNKVVQIGSKFDNSVKKVKKKY